MKAMFFSQKEAQRQERYKLFCAANEIQYLDSDDFGVKSLLKYFDLCKHGGGKIRNLSKYKIGIVDTEIYVFDYKYTISTGKTSVAYDQTVYFINSKTLGLPEFKMKPENLGDRIAAYFGWDDIDFETYPIFSDKYHLKGDQEEYIRYTFDDKVLKFFSKTSGWTIEAANYYLLFYSHNSLVPENIINDFYRLGNGVFELFKLKNEESI